MKRLCLFLLLAVVVSSLTIDEASAKFPLVKQFICSPYVPNSQCLGCEVAVDGRNRIHIAWSRSRSEIRRLYYRRFDSNGNPLTDVVDITPPGKDLFMGELSIGCNETGNFAIASLMDDSLPAPLGNNQPLLWFSDSTGEMLQPPVVYGGDVPYYFVNDFPAVVVGQGGTTIVAWHNTWSDYGDSQYIYYQVYDRYHAPLGPTRSACAHQYYSYGFTQNARAAVAPSGRFVVVWKAAHPTHSGHMQWPFLYNQVLARIFDADGTPLSGEIYVDCEGFPETCSGDSTIFLHGKASGMFPDVAVQDNGDFAVIYRRDYAYCGGMEYFCMRRFYADGTPKGPNVRCNDLSELCKYTYPSRIVSDSTGNLLAVWSNNNSIYGHSGPYCNIEGQRFGSDGERIGGNYRFNDIPASEERGTGWMFSVDMNNNGLVAIIWFDENAIAEGDGLVLQIMDISDIGFYIAGDANDDRIVDVSDAVFLISYIFSGGYGPKDVCGGDASGDQLIDISDVVVLVNYIFGGGTIPGLCPGQ